MMVLSKIVIMYSIIGVVGNYYLWCGGAIIAENINIFLVIDEINWLYFIVFYELS